MTSAQTAKARLKALIPIPAHEGRPVVRWHTDAKMWLLIGVDWRNGLRVTYAGRARLVQVGPQEFRWDMRA